MHSRTTCICHWDGYLEGARYVGGRKVAVVVDKNSTFDGFCEDVCRCLSIDRRGKVFEYSPEVARELTVEMSNDANFQSMLVCNNGLAMVYVKEGNKSASGELFGTQFSYTNLSTAERCQTLLLTYHPTSPGIDRSSDPVNDEQSVEHENNKQYADPENCEPYMVPEEEFASLDFDICEEWQGRYMSEPQPSERITVGAQFYDKYEFKQTLAEYCLLNRFNYKYKYNNQKYYKVQCKFEGCPWSLVAGVGKKGHMVVIRKITGDHQHLLQAKVDYKPEIMAKYLENRYMESIRDATEQMTPGQIGRAVLADFEIKIPYMQAWRTKEKAEQTIRGKPGEGYCYIPWMCNKLKEHIPGTIADFRVDDNNEFRQLYVSYGPNIEGFLSYCRPIIFVDSCHRTEGYGGTIFPALAADADNGLYPMAYSFASAENDTNWDWFFEKLKGSLRDREVVVMSVRNKSILKAVVNHFSASYSSHCYRHLKQNFKTHMKGLRMTGNNMKLGEDCIDAIAYATTPEQFVGAMRSMELFSRRCYEWVVEQQPHHWAKAQFPHKRWGIMSMNPAKSLNAWTGRQNLRQQNIFIFMKDHLLMMSTFQRKKFHECRQWKEGISKRTKSKMDENQAFAIEKGYICYPSGSNVKYTVQVWGYCYVVNLEERSCSCKWMVILVHTQ